LNTTQSFGGKLIIVTLIDEETGRHKGNCRMEGAPGQKHPRPPKRRAPLRQQMQKAGSAPASAEGRAKGRRRRESTKQGGKRDNKHKAQGKEIPPGTMRCKRQSAQPTKAGVSWLCARATHREAKRLKSLRCTTGKRTKTKRNTQTDSCVVWLVFHAKIWSVECIGRSFFLYSFYYFMLFHA